MFYFLSPIFQVLFPLVVSVIMRSKYIPLRMRQYCSSIFENLSRKLLPFKAVIIDGIIIESDVTMRFEGLKEGWYDGKDCVSTVSQNKDKPFLGRGVFS